MTSTAWVVGSGGLLGGAVTAELRRRGQTVLTSSVPWRSADQAREVMMADARQFAQTASGPSAVLWCAGAGVNGTSRDEFAEENALMGDVLTELERHRLGDNLTMLHASSAGGVYAATPNAPHDEYSDVAPLGDYGHAKLQAEDLAREFGVRSGARVVVARFANLYGPGQNLSKPQGLISHLCRGYLLAAPVSIYVPMDTLRDYLYIRDAAEMVADAIAHAHQVDDPGPTTKIFASGQAVTIGAILGACRTVFRRRPTVVQAASPLSSMQGVDLRLRSVVWPEIDRRAHRTLPAGIASTLQATRAALVNR